ncbi:hypothetical protein L1887_63190 [Cichorium endivia]|nr:hypothetical protein L1887_63190 [Cichorium endivia]
MVRSSQQLTERLELPLERLPACGGYQGEARHAKQACQAQELFCPHSTRLGLKDTEASDLHQEAVYVLGASLRLIMDVPEYVWKSIEKGKTLQASWAFLLAKAAWNDLTDASSRHRSQSALLPDAEMGIASVTGGRGDAQSQCPGHLPFHREAVAEHAAHAQANHPSSPSPPLGHRYRVCCCG